MFAAILTYCVPRAVRIGLAADSYSCRDQGKTRGESARVLPQTIRGHGSGIHIPAFTITRDVKGAIPRQVSLGNTKWAQEILRPMSVVSQSETTTTKQHNYKTTPDGGKGTGAAEQGPGADPSGEEQERRRRLAPAGAPPLAPAAAAAGREEGPEEQEQEGTAQQVVSPSSSSSSSRRRSSEQQRRRSSSSRSADDDASSSSLLSQPGPAQEPGRPRGNPPPPSDMVGL